MLRYNILYFLLFVLLITGAFASMAQNAYGMDLLGIVAFSFSMVFLARLFSFFFSGKRDLLIPLEWAALTILSLVLGLRIYYIWFEGVEGLFAVAGITLMVLYVVKLRRSYHNLQSEEPNFRRLIGAFYLSLLCYLASMTITPFFPVLGEPLGGLGFFFMILFLFGSYRLGKFSYKDDRISTVNYVTRSKDGSIVLAAMFIVFTAYMGLSKFDLIPSLYSNQYPQAYYKLVSEAESGEEKEVKGKFQHEIFKEKYESFISRNGALKNE